MLPEQEFTVKLLPFKNRKQAEAFGCDGDRAIEFSGVFHPGQFKAGGHDVYQVAGLIDDCSPLRYPFRPVDNEGSGDPTFMHH